MRSICSDGVHLQDSGSNGPGSTKRVSVAPYEASQVTVVDVREGQVLKKGTPNAHHHSIS